MKPASKFDAIVIGGGHNGLVCAAYLARAGQKVCVLERRHVLGGCATTEELWPGYKVSTAAYVISLFLPQIIRELKLKEYGLDDPAAEPVVVHAAARWPQPADGAGRRRSASARSPSSARTMPRRIRATTRFWSAWPQVLEPVLSQAAPDPLPLPDEWRRHRPRQAAPRRQEAVGAVPRAGRTGRRLAAGGRAAHRRRPGRFSIAGSRATC